MSSSIFRKKNIERITSPDALNNAVNVLQPAVWVVATALLLVLAGFFIWAVFGSLTTTARTVMVSENGDSGCYVSEDDYDKIKPGMEAVFADDRYELGGVSLEKCGFAKNIDDYVAHLGDFDENEFVYYFEIEDNVPDGIREGKVITEKISPISFLWN